MPTLVFLLTQSYDVVEHAFHPLNSTWLVALNIAVIFSFFQGRDGLPHQGAAVALRFVPHADAVNHVKTPYRRGVGYVSANNCL